MTVNQLIQGLQDLVKQYPSCDGMEVEIDIPEIDELLEYADITVNILKPEKRTEIVSVRRDNGSVVLR